MNSATYTYIFVANRYLEKYKDKPFTTLAEFLDSTEGKAGMFLQNVSRMACTLFEGPPNEEAQKIEYMTEGQGFFVLTVLRDRLDEKSLITAITLDELIEAAKALGLSETQLIATLKTDWESLLTIPKNIVGSW